MICGFGLGESVRMSPRVKGEMTRWRHHVPEDANYGFPQGHILREMKCFLLLSCGVELIATY